MASREQQFGTYTQDLLRKIAHSWEIDPKFLGETTQLIELGADRELEILVECIRTSAQDTLAALHRRGFRIVRDPARAPP